MSSDKVDESKQTAVVAASSDLSKEDESKQAEIQGLIAIQMQAIKLEKEQRKRLAKQE